MSGVTGLVAVHDKFAISSRKVAKIARELDSANMSELYGLYKQATCGDCSVSSPPFYKVRESLKWSAWDDKRGMSQDVAQTRYIEHAERIMED